MTEPNPNPQNAAPGWQSQFIALLPEIESRLRYWFRDLNAEAREKAVDDGVVHCVLGFAGLCEKGREGNSTLAKGLNTSEVAHKHRLSAGPIAQMRRDLKVLWQRFQGVVPYATAS